MLEQAVDPDATLPLSLDPDGGLRACRLHREAPTIEVGGYDAVASSSTLRDCNVCSGGLEAIEDVWTEAGSVECTVGDCPSRSTIDTGTWHD